VADQGIAQSQDISPLMKQMG